MSDRDHWSGCIVDIVAAAAAAAAAALVVALVVSRRNRAVTRSDIAMVEAAETEPRVGSPATGSAVDFAVETDWIVAGKRFATLCSSKRGWMSAVVVWAAHRGFVDAAVIVAAVGIAGTAGSE